MDCRFHELDFIVRLKSILFLNLAVKHLVVAPGPAYAVTTVGRP